MNLGHHIAKQLLEIQAVSLSPLEPFVWASGMRAPIYCDNRLTISYPKIRKVITQALVEQIQELYPDVDAIVGTATAGIPQACWVADAMDLPMAYVRSSAKTHGLGNAIEGALQAGMHVVVIEDLISTGKSSIQVAHALQEAGMVVCGVISIFSYDLVTANTNFKQEQISVHALCTIHDLMDCAKDTLSVDAVALLELWRQDPVAYDQKVRNK